MFNIFSQYCWQNLLKWAGWRHSTLVKSSTKLRNLLQISNWHKRLRFLHEKPQNVDFDIYYTESFFSNNVLKQLGDLYI